MHHRLSRKLTRDNMGVDKVITRSERSSHPKSQKSFETAQGKPSLTCRNTSVDLPVYTTHTRLLKAISIGDYLYYFIPDLVLRQQPTLPDRRMLDR